MRGNLKSLLGEIEEIEGILVPGQELALLVLASSLKERSTIVEIGSFKGKSTACLALGSPKTATVYAIDTFKGHQKDFSEGVQFTGGSFYKDFEKNLKEIGVFCKTIPLTGFSAQIGKNWNKPIDLLFIDGSHIYEDVKKDYELFYPWVRPGGIVAFHDVDQKFPGVYKVWNKYIKDKLSAHDNFHTLFFGFKPKNILSKIIDLARIKFLKLEMG